MSEPQYSLRPRKQLDYAQVNVVKSVQFPVYGFSPDQTHDEPVGELSSQDIKTKDFTELQCLLDQEKEKNKVLEETSKLEHMRKELEALRLRNAALEKHASPQDPLTENATLQDLRVKSSLTAKVEHFFTHLEDSSSGESADEEKSQKSNSRGRQHTLKSGKASKLTSHVVCPQLWPHSHLSLSYISKEKKYDELTLAEFATRYATILQRPNLPPQELHERIVHLSSLMYLATQFTWSSVRDLHAAVLFEIECGQARWGDSFRPLESRILQAPVKQSRTGPPRTESSAAVFFCRNFQHGVCKSSKDHYGTLRGERKWLQHICPRCWVDTRVVARHTEFLKECPLATEEVSTTSEPTASPRLKEFSQLISHDSHFIQDSRHLPDTTPDSRLSLSPLSQDCHLPEINQDSKLAVSHVNQDDTLPKINQDSRLSLSKLNQDPHQPEIIKDSRLSALNLNQDSSLNSCFHDFSSSAEDQYSLDSSRLSLPSLRSFIARIRRVYNIELHIARERNELATILKNGKSW